MKTTRILPCLLLLAACGGGASKLTVSLSAPSSPLFDPYATGNGLAKIRVVADGAGSYDDIALDLTLDARQVELEAKFEEGNVAVRVEGYDEGGNLVAFGAATIEIDGDVTVVVPFRRNVALVTHRVSPRQDHPEAQLYVIDVSRKFYVGEVRLPGTAPIARGVSARGGDSFLVTYDDGLQGFVGVLSSDDATWSTIALTERHDAAYAVPGKDIGVVAGGGGISLVDFGRGAVLGGFSIGGQVLDGAISANGERAIVVVDLSPGVLLVDLTDNCTARLEQSRCIVALDVVPQPAGLALAADGRLAYVVSKQDGTVASIDLETLQARNYAGRFPVGVGAAAFATEIQGVMALQSEASGFGRVHTFVAPSDAAVQAADAAQTFLSPTDIAADPSGRRMLVVSAGTSSLTAGLTVVEARLNPILGTLNIPIGSSRSYPVDPEEVTVDANGFNAYTRYRPSRLAILNGR